MKSRRNGTEVEFECRRNGSRRNGSRRNGTNHRRNGSRRNGSRQNGSDSVYRCHVPKTFNMRCAIPFHPSFTNCFTCKWSYIGKAPSPNHPDDISIMLHWIKVRRMTKANIYSVSLQKAECPACVRYEKLHHLASGTNPVMSERFV